MSPWLTHLRRHVRELARTCIDLLCPPACPGCGAATDGLCPACAQNLERRAPPLCPRCGTPTSPLLDNRCREDHRAIQGLHPCRAPFAYRGTGGALVRRAKFDADRAALAYLARAMADALAPWARGPGRRALVLSVPLHPRKRHSRGADQAAWLAAAIARHLHLAWLPEALRRERDTLPQGDVRVTSRAANVRDAFAVTRRRRRRIDGRRVVLVDDVRTSGSTARECARVLRAAGARSVALLTAVQA